MKRDPRREKTPRKRRNKAVERRGNGVMTCYCKYKTVLVVSSGPINEPFGGAVCREGEL